MTTREISIVPPRGISHRLFEAREAAADAKTALGQARARLTRALKSSNAGQTTIQRLRIAVTAAQLGVKAAEAALAEIEAASS